MNGRRLGPFRTLLLDLDGTFADTAPDLLYALNRLRREVPSLELSPKEARGSDLVEDLMRGDLDIALIGLPQFPDRLNAQPLYAERYVVGFRQGHAMESRATVPVAERSR